MTQPQTSQRTFHPLAWKVFVAGLVVLTAGVIRVNLFAPKVVPVQQVVAPATQSREPGPMRIVVTLPPLMWAVKSLAPPDAQITLLSPAGAGCEGIELTPSHVVAIERADLIVRVGSGLDDEVGSVVGTKLGLREVVMSNLTTTSYSNSVDLIPDSVPHAWLVPPAMEGCVNAIHQSVSAWMDERKAESEQTWGGCSDPVLHDLLKLVLRTRRDELSVVCREVDAEFANRLAPFKGRAIITHHDAWSAVARRYGLEVAAVIQPTHDAEPSPADLADVTRITKERGIKAIFIEPQLNPAAANRIAEITGANVLTLDPLGDGDWPAMMRKNLDALVEALSTP
jgi:zinc transport system substrate-binding protein